MKTVNGYSIAEEGDPEPWGAIDAQNFTDFANLLPQRGLTLTNNHHHTQLYEPTDTVPGLTVGNTETVVNDSSADRDFRIEGNGDANLLFCDAGNDRIGMGIATPDTLLHLWESSAGAIAAAAGTILTIENAGNAFIGFLDTGANNQGFLFGDTANASIGQFYYNHTQDRYEIIAANTGIIAIDENGVYIGGVANPAAELHIQKAKNTDSVLLYINNNGVAGAPNACGARINLTGPIDGYAGIDMNAAIANNTYALWIDSSLPNNQLVLAFGVAGVTGGAIHMSFANIGGGGWPGVAGLSFFGAVPVIKQTVAGAKGGNAALTSLCTALATVGLIIDATT